MNELTSLALELQSFCEQRNWRFCLIGGLAVQHWGEPRFTKDVDMTLLTGFGNEEPFIAEWLASYESRVPDPASFALCNRVLLLRSSAGIGIDIALGATNLDWKHIWEHLTPLAEVKESPEILSHLKTLLAAVRQSECSL